MWDQVYEKIIENWSELSIREKQKIRTQIQKKWRNLKDSFAKELAVQKKGKSGQGYKKRRPYVHFQALSFLVSQPLERETTSNISVEDSEEDSNNSVERENRKQARKKTQARETDRNEELLDIIRQKKTYDEDISFTEMLVPLLKKLNDGQKHFAKVEILSILNIAKRYRPPEFQRPQSQYGSASEPNRYDRIPYRQDSCRRMSSVMSNYTPSPPSTSESPAPAYVMSPTPSPNYASSQPLPQPASAYVMSPTPSPNYASSQPPPQPAPAYVISPTPSPNYASSQPPPQPAPAYVMSPTPSPNYASSQPPPQPAPAYVMSPTPSPNYATSQPLPQQAQASTLGNQAIGTSMMSVEMKQGYFCNDPNNYATLVYDEKHMKIENNTQRNPANIRVSENTLAEIIYSADTASPVVGRGNGVQMKDFLIFKRS